MILTALQTGKIDELITEADKMLGAPQKSYEPIDTQKKDNLRGLKHDLKKHQEIWQLDKQKVIAFLKRGENHVNKELQKYTTHSRRDAEFNPDHRARSKVKPGNKIREALCKSEQKAQSKLESIHKKIQTIKPDKHADEIQSLFTIYFLSVDTIKKKYGIKP